MSANKLNIFKTLIILGCFVWLLPAKADETTSTIDVASSTPDTQITSTTADIAPTHSSTLTIRYQDQIIFNGNIELTSTTYHDLINNLDYPLNGTSTVFSLLVNADLQNDNFSISDDQFNSDWNSFYLNCINFSIATTTQNKCGDWQYTVNGEYPALGMDKKEIFGNENIYIYFGDRYNFTTEKNLYNIDEIATTTLKEYNYSTNDWGLMDGQLILATTQPDYSNWPPAQTISSITTTNGLVLFQFATSGTYYITLPDYSYWPNLTISVTSTTSTSQNNTSTPETGGGGGGGGSGSPTNELISQQKINDTVNKLISFIKSKQGTDGKIIDAGTSDWLTMSFAADNIYAANVKNGATSLYDYVYNYENTLLDQELNSCAAYSRHILALLASGVAKTDPKINALKTKLDGCVQNNNFGLPGINDDIFGLLSALAIGEDQNSSVVQNTVVAIKANQEADGGFAYPGPFESPDLTGAALSALKYAQNNGSTVEANIFNQAKQYLKAQQLADGGWGFGTSDALTTGWAVMGINALGEDQTSWFNSNHKNPWYILITLNDDHYIQSWDGAVDWFGTKHAVPALLGKSWPIILAPLASNQNTADSASSGGSGTPSTSTQTTSIITPTSTPTTTPIVITLITSTPDQATTTGEVLGEKITRETETIKPIINKPKKLIAKNTLPTVKTELAQTTQSEPQTIYPINLPETKQPDNSNRNTVKIILIVSGTGALLIGIYLGLKSLKK